MSTRYWVAAVRAELFARLGDFDACNRALGEAEQVARAAIELAQQTRSGYVKRKIQSLQGQLLPLLSDRRISHLSQEIAMLGSTK